MVVGRLLSYWEGSFSGAMLNFGRVPPSKPTSCFGRQGFSFCSPGLTRLTIPILCSPWSVARNNKKTYILFERETHKNKSGWLLLWNQDVSRSLLISLTKYTYSNNDTYVSFYFVLRTLHICSPQVPKWLWKCNITLFTYKQQGTWIYIYILLMRKEQEKRCDVAICRELVLHCYCILSILPSFFAL